ncbi:hypothetical protein JCM10207_009083 [Rhodosporidiobolus poonsookiae]
MLLHTSLSALLAAFALSSTALAAPASSSSSSSSHSAALTLQDGSPVIDLGSAGKYKGVVQNNGTVYSWKAVPYAAPPVGDLRFKAPRALAAQNNTVQDVSADFDGQPTACVQFGTTSFVGVNAGPGQEDCLKLWIWAPAGAKEGDKLPVQVYTHGGGMQNSQSPNNDFADFVGQSKGFIAVNANYRLGALGFFNSEGAQYEGETANVGLLDSRFAVDWVHKHIAKFGGDPNNIAISGQSGGGGAIMTQLILYDGKKPNFQKAIPRSIQNYAAYPVAELTPRNDAFSSYLNCTDSASTQDGAKKQLACMRQLTSEQIRLGALDFSKTKQDNGFSWPGWLPSIDGTTLTDQPVRLFREGKVAKVPTIAAHVTNEIIRLNPHPNGNFTDLARTTFGSGITPELQSELERVYPAPIVNASMDTNTYADVDARAFALLNDNAANGGAYMVARGMHGAGQDSWMLRFNSPEPVVTYEDWWGASHSSDNYYLQNATSTMNSTQQAVAYEWRAYVQSFLKHSNPNTDRLPTAPEWHTASTDFRFLPRLVISQQLEAGANLSLPTTTGMELVPANEWDRLHWWMSEEVASKSRQ